MEKQMTADEVINLYQDYCSRKWLSDEYLESKNYDTRDDDWNLVGEYEYGMVYLRDDGVDILISEIERLRKIIFNAGLE